MTTSPSNTSSKQPREWCDPEESFGKIDGIGTREWIVPSRQDPVEYARFLAAVTQNAIVVHARMYKNLKGYTRAKLAKDDGRNDYSANAWDKKFNGRAVLTATDIAVLISILPGAMPDADYVKEFIDASTLR